MAQVLKTYTDSDGNVRTYYEEEPETPTADIKWEYNPETRKYQPTY